MNKQFPKPSWQTDNAAGLVKLAMDGLDIPNAEKNFTVIVASLTGGKMLIAISGAKREEIEGKIVDAMGPPFNVCQGLSSIRTSALNPWEGSKKYGLTYGGTYDCAEPKILEGAALIGRQVTAWTVFWYSGGNNKKGKNPYPDDRAPLITSAHGLSFIQPCPKCQANELRLVAYMDQGWQVHGKPKFGSYESPLP